MILDKDTIGIRMFGIGEKEIDLLCRNRHPSRSTAGADELELANRDGDQQTDVELDKLRLRDWASSGRWDSDDGVSRIGSRR